MSVIYSNTEVIAKHKFKEKEDIKKLNPKNLPKAINNLVDFTGYVNSYTI
jgi:hypothetical protein